MNRNARLQSARHWITSYSGRDIVKGYRKWFGVDTVCAILELRRLGVDMPETRLFEAKRTEETTAQRRLEQRRQAAEAAPCDESDESFAFIAGCTLNGVPYGVSWEELEDTDDYDGE